jgi:hypothetical protein
MLHGDNVLVNNPASSLLGRTRIGRSMGMDPAVILQKQQQRQAKVQQGADWIRGAIDTEYGAGFRTRVFQHVRQQNPQTDLDHRITKQDLGTIQNAIQTLQAADLNATQLIQANTPALGNPLTNLNASVLITIATDSNVSLALRDQAATLFQTSLMNLNAQQREGVLTQTNTLLADGPLINSLFTLQLSNGTKAFSVQQLSTIAHDQFQRDTPTENPNNFFRGNTVASSLLSNALTLLDGGYIPTLGNAMVNLIDQEIANATLNGTAIAVQGSYTGNPAVVNPVLTSVDGLLRGQNQTPELHTFLTAVANGIDAGPPANNVWTGASFMQNAVMLRGLGPAVTSGTAEPQGGGTAAERARSQIGVGVSAALQQVMNQGAQFAGTSRYVGLNQGVNAMLQGGSGLNAFLLNVP